MKIRFSSLSRDFEEKKARKIFVLCGIRTRDLALHIFRWQATLQSCVVPAFSAPWCSCCMVGPDGAVAFFYGQGSNPARHRVNPSIQRRPTAWITARRWRARQVLFLLLTLV